MYVCLFEDNMQVRRCPEITVFNKRANVRKRNMEAGSCNHCYSGGKKVLQSLSVYF